MGGTPFEAAIERLQEEFAALDFTGGGAQGGQREAVYSWPGPPQEDILICVHKSSGEQEPFHRHDFFYFNYTYRGEYDSLSHRYDRRITIRENELYAGQPFAGHALCVHDNQETIIIGVLVRRETFFRAFLPLLSTGSRLFRFFLDPVTRHHAEEFIHFKVEDACGVRALLEMMVLEYAHRRPDTQAILRPLTLAFLMQLTRQYAASQPPRAGETLCEQIVLYMNEHIGHVSLGQIAARFSYHPNYLSTLLRRELGKTFSELLLEQRMERALILLRGTTLSVEEIAFMLGYSNSSNFHKAFRAYYGRSPRGKGDPHAPGSPSA